MCRDGPGPLGEQHKVRVPPHLTGRNPSDTRLAKRATVGTGRLAPPATEKDLPDLVSMVTPGDPAVPAGLDPTAYDFTSVRDHHRSTNSLLSGLEAP